MGDLKSSLETQANESLLGDEAKGRVNVRATLTSQLTLVNLGIRTASKVNKSSHKERVFESLRQELTKQNK